MKAPCLFVTCLVLLAVCVAPSVAAPAAVLSEGFEGYGPGPLGPPWEADASAGTTATISTDAASPWSGGVQGLRLVDPSPQDLHLFVYRTFPPIASGTVVWEYDFRTDNPQSYFGFFLKALITKQDGSQDEWLATHVRLGGTHEMDGKKIMTLNYRMTKRDYPMDLQAGMWYHLKQTYQSGADTMALEVTPWGGQTQRFPNLVAGDSHPWIDRLVIGAPWPDGQGTLDVDNLRLSVLPGPTLFQPEVHGPVLPTPNTAPSRFAAARAAVDARTGGQVSREGFWCSAADSLTELFPDTFLTTPAPELRLSAARGESESCQLLVTAVRPQSVTARAGGLRGPAGARIGSSAVATWLVGYEKSGLDSPRAPGRQWWPEFLLPQSAFTVPAGQSRAVWITVTVPRDAVPGDYSGSLLLRTADKTTRVPLRLHVYGFTLPEQPALQNDNWWMLDDYNGYSSYFDRRDLGQYEDSCRFLARYRTSCALIGNDLLPELVKITRTGPEQYRFDFARFDQYLEIAFRYGVTGWNPNMSCNSGFVAYLAGQLWFDVKGTDAATGQEVVLVPKRTMEFANQEAWHRQLVKDIQQPISRQFWPAYVAHLKAKGWLAPCNFELMDENEGTEAYVAVHRALRELVPDLRLMSYGSGPVSHPKAVGINGTWAPLLPSVAREAPAMAERRAAGDRVWMYVCGGRASARTGHTPDIYMSDPPLDRRMLAWFCWKYDLEGFLFFATNMWRPQIARDPGQYDFPVLPVQYWDKPTSNWDGADVGRIVYPWKQADGTYRLIPGIRLECLRDGMDDFDYLALLRAKQPDHALLRLPERILVDPLNWTKDSSLVLDYREQLARALEGG